MSSYTEYIKNVKMKDLKYFFGESAKMVSNQYFKFSRVIDEDNIIIVTKNVRVVKDSLVLVVGNNKAVYLKDWQVRDVHNFDNEINGYAVKLNRNYFKVYTFKTDFDDIAMDDEDTFEAQLNVAKAQDAEGLKWALGHMN